MVAPALREDYVELHLHTNYSLLDGASHPKELIGCAREFGYRALACTDHDNLFGALEFARLCREAGIKPITGAELTVSPDGGTTRHHLTLLCRTREGYGNLCRLLSLVNGLDLPTQEERERCRLDPWLPLSEVGRHADGLLCLTGCRQAEIPQLVAAGREREAEAALRRLISWFGWHSVFVEVQDNLVFGDRRRNHALRVLAERVGVPLVATGDIHYHQKDRHRLQDVLVAIRHRQSLDESHRVLRPNAEFYLRRPEEQARRFREFPEAVAQTRRIADLCEFDLNQDLGYRLPEPPVPEGRTPLSWLDECCRTELRRRYSPGEQEAAESRLDEELQLIGHHGLAGFFLVYKEVLDLAREVAAEVREGGSTSRGLLPPGRGRGSSVGSIVCYLIGLSHIDPVRNKLFLGRFLNEEMASLPDIDLDFPRATRERLIERVHERWGPDHAALVATIPRYRIRSAIRDIGLALGLPQVELDRLAKLTSGYTSSRHLGEEMARVPQFAPRVTTPAWGRLIDLANQIDDFPRHLSQHVGGIVIASDPLVECVPVQPAAWPDRYVCHWDKDSIDDARMVKIDFLGLAMLSVVEECLDLVAEGGTPDIDLSRIPFDDGRVFGRIQDGDTVGVFQIESRAQAQMLPRTRPKNLDDLTVQVAIVRPGPIVGGAVNPYVKAREMERERGAWDRSAVDHTVADVLEETMGVVLFQEQVVQVAMAMGGMSAGRAESFRRAMSRHDWERERDEYRSEFLAGAAQKGVLEGTASTMFENLAGFASFGFPKSHAAAFGLLAYQSAWLKEYHPVEFYTALYNNWPMGFYPPHVFTNDARRHDVEVLPPDVNISQAKCTVEGGAVRIGLGYVQGLGEVGGRVIVEARDEMGDFASLFDFVQRTGLTGRAVENLIKIGGFDRFRIGRRDLLWQQGLLAGGGRSVQAAASSRPRQLHLGLPTAQDEVFLRDFSDFERVAADYEILRLSPNDHPMSFQRARLRLEGVRSAEELHELAPGGRVTTAGLVVCRQQPMTANGIIFLLLEDETGLSNLLVPRQLCERDRERVLIRSMPFLRVSGRLEGHAGAVPMLVCDRIDELEIHGREDPLLMPAGKSWG